MKRFAHDKNIKISLLTSKMKALFHEGNMKVFRLAGRAQAARPGRMEAKFRGFGYGFPVVVYIRKAVSRLRRTAGIAIVAVATTATLGAAAPGHPAAVADTVASGPARSLGEPTAAQDSAVTAVVATSFGAAGAQVRAWTKPAQAPS